MPRTGSEDLLGPIRKRAVHRVLVIDGANITLYAS
jgi:hypothetical protein